MATHGNHHYVPAFLLRQWQAPETGKLREFSWGGDGRLLISERSAKRVANLRHLYSARRSEDLPDSALERDYLGPHVDDPAAVVHDQMLQTGLQGFNQDTAGIWSRFLVAQMLRVPAMVERARQRGNEILRATLDVAPAEYEAARGDAKETTFNEWLESHGPDVYDDLAINAIPHIIESKLLNGAMLRAHWILFELEDSKLSLLVGDRPLVQIGKLTEDFLIALPISPRRLFIAYTREEYRNKFLNETQTNIVKRANHSTVSQAVTYVFAADTTHEPLVRKYLS